MVCRFLQTAARSRNRASSAFNRGRQEIRGLKQFYWMLLPMLLCCPLTSVGAANNIPADTVHQVKKPPESPIKYSSVLYNPGNRRDPFANPLLLVKKGNRPEDEEESRGVAPPGIKGTYIAQAALQGIAIRDNARVAVFRGADSRAYFLRKGDRLFDGYLKEIHDGFVTLVRETKLRSGKTLTQDVTKRLRTP